MNKFTTAVQAFLADEDGVTAIEYGLIAALIAAALGTAVGFVTGGLNTVFENIKNTLVEALP
ncbi:MAG TPA: Flp family type IVb pilin [Telluria sp.]|nr:Flp family type IVb pilin [Telluria sp.]